MRDGYIGVFGANGHTGRFVSAELKRRGLRARLIGRDSTAVAALRSELGHGDVRVASVEDPTSLARALQDLDAVINCAGPFFDTSRPLIEAALAAGIDYLDVTAEQPTVRDTIARWDQPAKDAGCIVMPAIAFYGGLADLVATTILGEWRDVDAIDIAVALDSWHPTTGTRVTGERNTATRVIVRDGALVPVPTPALTSTWDFPEPFGQQPVRCVALSEIITVSRHVTAKAITSWMNMRPLADLADERTPPPKAADARGRSAQRFAMAVRATNGAEVREAVVSGQDIYAVSAPIIVEAAIRLLDGDHHGESGVRSAGEIFDAPDFLESLADVLTLDYTPSPSATEHVT